MKRCLLFFVSLLTLLLTFGSSAYAGIVWNTAANGIAPPNTGNWNVAENWTNELPDTDSKVQFRAFKLFMYKLRPS